MSNADPTPTTERTFAQSLAAYEACLLADATTIRNIRAAAIAAKDDEIERLRAWLQIIADRHLGDQPAARGEDEDVWAKHHIALLRRFARRGLNGEVISDAE